VGFAVERWHVTARDTFVVLLTATTGAVDAASFLALGNVFSSVITGNLVLLGIAAGVGRSALAVHSGVALAGYSAGVLVGGPIAARRTGGGGTWPPSVTVTLAAELCVLAAFSVGWELTGGHPGGGAQLALVSLLAAAMGMQSAAVRQLGQMSSTYLTSTLTGVLAGLVTRDKPDGLARSVGVLVAIIVGAFAGSIVWKAAPVWLPGVVLVPLAGVVIASATGFEHVRRHLGGGIGG
jgi:uncharacterized membrane protein YoaK (UPF0700 family)